MARALFIGRFQPFHNGHFKVLSALLRKYSEVVVAIGSAEQTMTPENPFSAGERIEMIRSCFPARRLSRLILVPVRDIHQHTLWVSHLLGYVPAFDVVYSNNPLVQLLFSSRGIRVRSFDLTDRACCQGKVLRERMLKGQRWQPHVPAPVARHLQKMQAIRRLQKLFMANPSLHARPGLP